MVGSKDLGVHIVDVHDVSVARFKEMVLGMKWRLSLASSIFYQAMADPSSISLEEKMFVLQAALELRDVPFKYRPTSYDDLLADFLGAGVCDYKEVQRGTDRVVDSFYEDPRRATTSFSKVGRQG